MNPYQKDTNNLIRAGSKFACAQTSAIAAGYFSYPFDTIRRRLQMQSEKPVEEWRYKGTADCFAKIIKDEGTGALFKGAGANALRTVDAAMVLVLYLEITGAVALSKCCIDKGGRSSSLSFLPSTARGGWPGTTALHDDADAIVPPLHHRRYLSLLSSSRSSCPASSPLLSRLNRPQRRQRGHCPPGPAPRCPSRPVDCVPGMRCRRRSDRRLPRPRRPFSFSSADRTTQRSARRRAKTTTRVGAVRAVTPRRRGGACCHTATAGGVVAVVGRSLQTCKARLYSLL